MLVFPAVLAGAPADEPVITVAVDRDTVNVGDPVTATYTAKLPARGSLELDALVTPAPAGGSTGSGPVLDYARPSAPSVAAGSDGASVYTLKVRVTPFAAGEIPVPGPHFVWVAPSGERTPVRGASALLHVASRLPQDQKPESLAPKNERPIRIPSYGPLFWVAIGLAVLAAAALVFWLVRRRRAKGEAAVPAPPALPPLEELTQELDRLSRVADSLGDDPRGFYSELTHAAKRYLERRLDLPVLEWTTFETIRRLRERNLEPPREIGLSELLGAADRVKFGKGRATREEARAHVERARLLARHMEARLVPPPIAADSQETRA